MIEEIKKGRLINGDCLDILKTTLSNIIDIVVTDPPYGIKYFHKYGWDKKLSGIEIWIEILRVMKPGALAFVMCSPRQDVLSQQILILKTAGFEVGFTSLYWVYKTGMPKAKNMSHLSDGDQFQGAYAGFQPKPTTEVILVAMKPLSEKSYTAQAKKNGKGVTYLDNCRIPVLGKDNQLSDRFMSNLIVSDKVLDPFNSYCGTISCTNKNGNSFRFSLDNWAKHTLPYLIVPKPSVKEKDFGLDSMPENNILFRDPGQQSFNVPQKPRPSTRKNIHPTVKPIKLMAYIIALGSHQGEIVLDPFCGSGTTGVAAMLMGRKFICVEKDAEFYNIADARLKNFADAIKRHDRPESAPIKRLSEVESITLSWDNSIIDMQDIPSAIDQALKNPGEQNAYEGFEISTTFKKDKPVKSEKEKDNVQDWADKGINISKGCSNNCRYCYAREESVRRHGNVYENWTNEQLNQKMIKKGWRRSSKRLMFPTTHDITPGTYDFCESVLKKLLGAGNQILVVSKPRFDLIEKLCDALEPYKAQVMFRFTISARNNEILSFWEPNAPCYEDRVDALIIAHSKGFRTSVSIEPMLDPADIKGLVEDLRPYTSDSMWIGPVKMIRKRTRIDSQEIELEVQKIEAGQTPEKLLEVYNLYKDDPLIKWKGHFRKLLRKIGIEVPEQNDDWRDKV